MKQFRWLVLLILFLIPTTILAQNYEFSYGYDASGNRTSRTFTLKSATIPQKDSISSRQEISEIEPEILEDLINDRKVRIYPNPTRGAVGIEIPELQDLPAMIRLFGIQGNLIRTFTVKGEFTNIDLSNQSPGMYILKISVGGQSSDWKIIKE
jgi:YD repeat-containing protein